MYKCIYFECDSILLVFVTVNVHVGSGHMPFQRVRSSYDRILVAELHDRLTHEQL